MQWLKAYGRIPELTEEQENRKMMCSEMLEILPSKINELNKTLEEEEAAKSKSGPGSPST